MVFLFASEFIGIRKLLFGGLEPEQPIAIFILAKIIKGGFGTRPYAEILIPNYQCIINRIRDIDL